MGRITEFLLDLIQRLFADWGYLVVFFGTMLENVLLLGLFVPGAVVLVLAGITVSEGNLNLVEAILVGITGTTIGDTASYCAGRFGWQRALRHAESLPFMGAVQAAMRRRTTLFVLSYHFFGYTRVLGPTMAGMSKIPFRRWYITDLIGAALWVSSYTGGGYLLGRAGINFESAKEYVKDADRWLAVIGVGSVVLVVLIRHLLQKRASRLVSSTDTTDAIPEAVTVEAESLERTGR